MKKATHVMLSGVTPYTSIKVECFIFNRKELLHARSILQDNEFILTIAQYEKRIVVSKLKEDDLIEFNKGELLKIISIKYPSEDFESLDFDYSYNTYNFNIDGYYSFNNKILNVYISKK